MALFIFSPRWFFGFDILIDIISLITLLLIAGFCYRNYRLDKERRLHLYLSLSFLALAASYFAKIATYVLIYYYRILMLDKVEFITQIAHASIQGTNTSIILFSLGVSLFRLIQLTGLYMLYSVYQERVSKSDIFLMIGAMFLITYFSYNSYFAYHVFALMLLIGIISKFYGIYQRNRLRNTLFVMSSFIIMALSQFLFIFEEWNPNFYVIAQTLQLAGYLLLLFTFITVVRHGKKKKQN